MTRREKRIIAFALTLVLVAVLSHELGENYANAEASASMCTPANTETHWSIINEDNTAEAWKILREEYSEVAAAAILGNLHHESRMCPYRLEGLTEEESEKNIGFYLKSRDKFIYMKYSFGLAQWYGTTNLSRLWDWCEENGYAVDSIEGQIRFLMANYPEVAEMSAKRMKLYKIEDIVSATEDYRQSYEKSHSLEESKYQRCKLAKSIYASNCEDIYTIETVSQAPMHFDIYIKVKELNERIENEQNKAD